MIKETVTQEKHIVQVPVEKLVDVTCYETTDGTKFIGGWMAKANAERYEARYQKEVTLYDKVKDCVKKLEPSKKLEYAFDVDDSEEEVANYYYVILQRPYHDAIKEYFNFIGGGYVRFVRSLDLTHIHYLQDGEYLIANVYYNRIDDCGDEIRVQELRAIAHK